MFYGLASEFKINICGMIQHSISLILFLKIFYLFIFRESGREGEREGEK